jgi:hypothetical protein
MLTILPFTHYENIRENEVCCRIDEIVMSAGYKFAVNQIWRHVKREIIVPSDGR